MDGLHFVLATHMFVSFMLAIIFFILWKTAGKKPYALVWATLFILAIVKAIFNTIPELFPSRDFYWIFVNAMSLLLQGLGFLGHRQRRRLATFPPSLWLYFIVMELGVIWFTLFQPHVGLKMALIPISGFIVMSMSAWVIVRSDRDVRPAEWACAAVYVLFGISQLVAGIVVLLQGANYDEYYLNIYRVINFMIHPGAFAGLGMFTVLIMADDISDSMRRFVITDQLTGALNRRGFEQEAQKIFEKAKKRSTKISVALLDVDLFKNINDTYGHAAGDDALRQVSLIIQDKIRTTDIVGRMGGEEFLIVMPRTDGKEALVAMERLREKVEQTQFNCDEHTVSLTVSIGFTEVDARHDSFPQAIKKADLALYKAKENGRNKTESLQQVLAQDVTQAL